VTSNKVTGSVTYTGGTVSASHKIYVYAYDATTGGQPSVSTVSSSPASYTVGGLNNGDGYETIYWYDTVNDGVSAPHVGDYVYLFGTGTCVLSNGTQFTAGGTTTRNLSFGTTNQVYGVAGTLTYSGSLNGGVVDGCHGLFIELYSDNTYTTSWGSPPEVVNNGARYDASPYNSPAGICGAQTVYYRAHYGSSNAIQSGDPYVQGSRTTANTANFNITLNDLSLTW
jgi:hypothetical protein